MTAAFPGHWTTSVALVVVLLPLFTKISLVLFPIHQQITVHLPHTNRPWVNRALDCCIRTLLLALFALIAVAYPQLT